MASSWFDQSYYLSAKAAYNNAHATGGLTTWTATSVQAAFNAAGITPEQHYTQYGWIEGLSPDAYYVESQYVTSKVAALNAGAFQGKTTWTSADFYSSLNGSNPFMHYVQYGAYETGVEPSTGFDDDTYYTDKAAYNNAHNVNGITTWTAATVMAAFQAAGLTPIGHYELYGQTEAFYTPTPTPVPGQTYTLTTGLDYITGTSGNDSIIGTLVDNGAGAYSTSSTLNLGDGGIGNGGNDTLNITSNIAGAYTATGYSFKDIQTINLNNTYALAGTALTFDASSTPQATSVNATGNGDLKVTNIGTAALGLVGITSNNAAAETVTAAGAKTLNISGTKIGTVAGSLLKVDISGGASTGVAQAVVVNSTGTTANVISDLKIGNLVDGASALTVHANAAFKTTTVTELVANTLKTVAIDGSTAGSVELGTLSSTALTSVDASGLTAGGAKVGIGDNVATTFKGGAGNDTLTIKQDVAMTGTADAGTGTADTLSISDAVPAAGGAKVDTSLTSTTSKLFTGFDVLQVSATIGSGTQAATDVATFDPTLLSSITSLNVGASTAGVKLINLGANSTIKLVGDAVGTAAGTGGITAVLKDATGLSDVVTLTMDNGKTDSTIINNGVKTDKLDAAGVETINIVSNGLVTNGGTANTVSTLDLATNTNLTKVVISGSQKVSVATGNGTNALTLDGATATGQLAINATGVTGKISINGGSANDTIVSSATAAAGGTIYGAGGGDAINLVAANLGETLVYKSATDSLADTTNVAGDTKCTQDAVSNFVTAADKVDLSTFAFSGAQTGAIAYGALVYTNEAAAVTAATTNSSTWFNDASSTTRAVKLVTDGTNAYMFVDADKSGSFDATKDLVVQLSGKTLADSSVLAIGNVTF